MRNWMLGAGAVALALAAPALAGPGGGHGGGGGGGGNPHGGGGGGGGGGNPHFGGGGGGGGHGGGHAMMMGAPHGGGGGMAFRGGGHGGGHAMHGGGYAMRGGGHGGGHMTMHGGGRHQAHGYASRGGRMHGQAHAQRMAERGQQAHANHHTRQAVLAAGAAAGAAGVATTIINRPTVVNQQGYGFADNGGRGLINGCPPGLAAKNNGCLPPGQAMKLVGNALPAAWGQSYLPNYYRSWYPDDQRYFYRYDNGYAYRVDRSNNLIDEVLPMDTGYGYYPVGQPYPLDWSSYNVPVQYSNYYPDGDYLYRYGDNAIYALNPQNGMVDGIAQLLAGDLGVGSPLPDGYDTYNVPLAYRDRYYDTPDRWYRYNDGYIYQVDPTTRLIQQVISAIA